MLAVCSPKVEADSTMYGFGAERIQDRTHFLFCDYFNLFFIRCRLRLRSGYTQSTYFIRVLRQWLLVSLTLFRDLVSKRPRTLSSLRECRSRAIKVSRCIDATFRKIKQTNWWNKWANGFFELLKAQNQPFLLWGLVLAHVLTVNWDISASRSLFDIMLLSNLTTQKSPTEKNILDKRMEN